MKFFFYLNVILKMYAKILINMADKESTILYINEYIIII